MIQLVRRRHRVRVRIHIVTSVLLLIVTNLSIAIFADHHHVVKSESIEQYQDQDQDQNQQQDYTKRVIQEVDTSDSSTDNDSDNGDVDNSNSNIITTTTMDTPISYTLYAPPERVEGAGGEDNDDDMDRDMCDSTYQIGSGITTSLTVLLNIDTNGDGDDQVVDDNDSAASAASPAIVADGSHYGTFCQNDEFPVGTNTTTNETIYVSVYTKIVVQSCTVDVMGLIYLEGYHCYNSNCSECDENADGKGYMNTTSYDGNNTPSRETCFGFCHVVGPTPTVVDNTHKNKNGTSSSTTSTMDTNTITPSPPLLFGSLPAETQLTVLANTSTSCSYQLFNPDDADPVAVHQYWRLFSDYSCISPTTNVNNNETIASSIVDDDNNNGVVPVVVVVPSVSVNDTSPTTTAATTTTTTTGMIVDDNEGGVDDDGAGGGIIDDNDNSTETTTTDTATTTNIMESLSFTTPIPYDEYVGTVGCTEDNRVFTGMIHSIGLIKEGEFCISQDNLYFGSNSDTTTTATGTTDTTTNSSLSQEIAQIIVVSSYTKVKIAVCGADTIYSNYYLNCTNSSCVDCQGDDDDDTGEMRVNNWSNINPQPMQGYCYNWTFLTEDMDSKGSVTNMTQVFTKYHDTTNPDTILAYHQFMSDHSCIGKGQPHTEFIPDADGQGGGVTTIVNTIPTTNSSTNNINTSSSSSSSASSSSQEEIQEEFDFSGIDDGTNDPASSGSSSAAFSVTSYSTSIVTTTLTLSISALLLVFWW